jgi:DNA-binding NtrC family response regulator
MPKEILSPEQTLKDASAPKEIVVDQSTARRLEELCSEMTDTCGQIEATLQLAVADKSQKRAAYVIAALNLSARGRKSVKMFLSEWGVLVEESKRENPGRSAEDSAVREPDPALIPECVTAYSLAGKNEPAQLAEMERCAVMNALRVTGGNMAAASRLLGIGKATLYRKVKEHDQGS